MGCSSTRALRVKRWALMALFGTAAACSDRDATTPLPGNGGTGGASPDPGGAGSAGAPVVPELDAGPDSGSSDAGARHFEATTSGQTIGLRPLANVWLSTCSEALRVVQRSGEAWVPLRDDRPESINSLHAAHYLDGAYQSDCRQSLGCDLSICMPFTGSDDGGAEGYARSNDRLLLAREHVQAGDAPAPSCEDEDAGTPSDAGSDAGSRRVPLIETRTPTGPLGVRVRYYLDSRCRTDQLTAFVPVE